MVVGEYTAELHHLVESSTSEKILELLGDLECLTAQLRAILNDATKPTTVTTQSKKTDRLLSPKDAAEILGVKERWLYDHADKIPGTRRLSPRCLRFSERKLHRWMEQRSP